MVSGPAKHKPQKGDTVCYVRKNPLRMRVIYEYDGERWWKVGLVKRSVNGDVVDWKNNGGVE